VSLECECRAKSKNNTCLTHEPGDEKLRSTHPTTKEEAGDRDKTALLSGGRKNWSSFRGKGKG
jgi:hypothetical protein